MRVIYYDLLPRNGCAIVVASNRRGIFLRCKSCGSFLLSTPVTVSRGGRCNSARVWVIGAFVVALARRKVCNVLVKEQCW